MDNLHRILGSEDGYLHFANNGGNWLADKELAFSGFFGRRFASALGHPELGDWKAMDIDPEIIQRANTAKQEALEKFKTLS